MRSKAVKPAPHIGVNHDDTNFTAQINRHQHRTSDEKRVGHDFTKARLKELRGLCERKVFQVVQRSSVPEDLRVYGTKWVDRIKHLEDGSPYMKSRLVSQNYRDSAATTIPTRSPTISRWAQWLALCFAAMCPEIDSYTRNISQAYVQSEDKLSREVYLEPPAEMDLAEDFVLKAIKPLYGIPESGVYWFATYHRHRKERLRMSPSKADPCFLYRKEKENHAIISVPNVAILQVDDSFGNGSESFLQDENKEIQRT